jgi:hypothetical protein
VGEEGPHISVTVFLHVIVAEESEQYVHPLHIETLFSEDEVFQLMPYLFFGHCGNAPL